MKITFCGATGTVTGSRYLVESRGARVLVDCGLFQGFKALRLRNWAPPPFDPSQVHSVLLTHAHLDHSGALPRLVKSGFTGRIRCTEATYELCRILLPDSGGLQEEQADHANRHGYSKHHPALPLYTREEALRALRHFEPVRFRQEFEVVPGLTARFTPAGHILGAACLVLDDGRRLAFSGDLGRPQDAVMLPPEPLERVDTLVLESTYGNRLHEGEDGEARLGRIISEAAARGGTVVIPSFAVGRAQALLLFLHRLRARGAVPPKMPIYLDSPMARDVTDLYLRFRDEHRLASAECEALAHAARIVNTADESRALDASPWPKVIVAGSGMATGGRVLHHIERYGPDPRGAIVFAGFQAPGTRGDALVHGATEVKLHGHHVPVRAPVFNLEGLSAHADWREIVAWLTRLGGPPGAIHLTHGEPAAADAMRIHIGEALHWDAQVPDYLSTAEA